MTLTLLADGIRVNPGASPPDIGLFRLNLPVEEIRLISGGARPKDVTGSTDTRQLGVALKLMRWHRVDETVEVPLQSSAFVDGFHNVEFDGTPPVPFRWTNGNAALPLVHPPSWRGAAVLELRFGLWEGSDLRAGPGREANLLGRFESLGDNCELAHAQRFHGVELPLTLFRWAGTTHAKLTAGLRSGFAGLGELATTEVAWVVSDYRLRTPYLNFHTAAGEALDAAGVAEVRRLGMASLRLLRRKFLRDLAIARRVFVFRSADPAFGPPEMRSLLASLRLHGPVSLLCVTRRGPGQGHARVERIEGGLYWGRLNSFVGPEGPFDEWLDICARAWALHEADTGQKV